LNFDDIDYHQTEVNYLISILFEKCDIVTRTSEHIVVKIK